MSAATGNNYSLLSDHPSDESRIKNIRGWMPEALKYYKGGSAAATNTSSRSVRSTQTFHISTKKK